MGLYIEIFFLNVLSTDSGAAPVAPVYGYVVLFIILVFLVIFWYWDFRNRTRADLGPKKFRVVEKAVECSCDPYTPNPTLQNGIFLRRELMLSGLSSSLALVFPPSGKPKSTFIVLFKVWLLEVIQFVFLAVCFVIFSFFSFLLILPLVWSSR